MTMRCGRYNFKYQVTPEQCSIIKFIYPEADYNDFGLSDLSEIDILTRINHPYIIHARSIKISSDGTIKLDLPSADRSLMDIIQNPFLTTDVKLPILYKIALGLEFLHQHHILHLNINPSNIILQGVDSNYHPLIIEFGSSLIVDDTTIGKHHPISRGIGLYQAPEVMQGNRQYNGQIDVWAFGMLMLTLINNKALHLDQEKFISDPSPFLDELLSGVRAKYQGQCKNLLLQIFKANPIERPTMTQICNDSLFQDYHNSQIQGSILEPTIKCDYAADHRDILKLIIHWGQEIYSACPVEMLFLAVDIYNRINTSFKDDPPDSRIVVAATCLWLAGKLTHSSVMSLSEYVPILNKIKSTITISAILDMELKIIEISQGVLYTSRFYPVCTTVDQIGITFTHLIMSRDSNIYATTDPSEWIITMQSLITNPTTPSNRYKNISIGELLNR